MAGLNLTALRAKINQLSAEQVRTLYLRLGFKSEEELYELLKPAPTKTSYQNLLLQYPEYRAKEAIMLFVPPIIIILGTFGNIASFIILRRKAMLSLSTYFYLAVLAITDTLVLYVGLLRLWVGELRGNDIKNQLDWLCKVINVVGYTVSDLSVWLIIAVTVERYIVVNHPLKATSMCTLAKARIMTIALLTIFLCINSHLFWTVEIVYFPHGKENVTQCRGGPSHVILVERVWPWVDIFLYSCIPFLLILALNTLIIRKVLNARRRRLGLVSQPAACPVDHSASPNSRNTKLTVMLLTISFSFLITTLPMTVCNIISVLEDRYFQSTMSQVARMKLARTVTELLMYINHSMNFFLYCATGQKFRQEFLWMMCHARRVWRTRHLSIPSENSMHTRDEYLRVNRCSARKHVPLEMTSSFNRIDHTTPLKWDEEP